MQPIIDPRQGDIEDDASSTKKRSMLALAGGMLVEISLPKLIIAWGLLLVVPGILLGLVPIATTMWFRAITDNVASPELGLWTVVLLSAAVAIGWFWFGEWPPLTILIGATIVIASGIYVILRERQLGLARREQREVGPSRMT